MITDPGRHCLDSYEDARVRCRASLEGIRVRASYRVLDKSHATISRWESRMVAQAGEWSASAPQGGEITLEQDELYTCGGENLSSL